MAFSGIALAYSAAGGLIAFSGIKGATISDTVKSLVSGNLSVQDTETVDFSGGSGSSNGSSSGSTSTAMVAANASQTQFVDDLLKALGAPSTAANVSSLISWMAHEEPQSDWNHWNNPMNTTQTESGSTSENSVGVQSYPSLSVGLQATVSTLNNGNYGDILMLLKSGQGLKSGASAGLLKWSGGGYSSV